MDRHSTNNLFILSDLHCGDSMGLHPPHEVQLDNNKWTYPSEFQKKLYSMYDYMINKWLPEATHHEDFLVTVNGDAIEGNHHQSTSTMTANPLHQAEIAKQVLEPLVDRASGLYMIKGTECHDGEAGRTTDGLAKALGAISIGKDIAHWELLKRVGDATVHLTHHIGVSAASHGEAAALNTEMTNTILEFSRNEDRVPDFIIRSHRHRYYKVAMPFRDGELTCATTPAWQGKTPFAFKKGIRMSQPQFGGLLIRQDKDKVRMYECLFNLQRDGAI